MGAHKEVAMPQVEAKCEPRQFTPAEIAAFMQVTRAQRGWSQDVLAELCKIDVRTIQRAEAGEKVGEATLRAIARAFGLDDIDFFNKAHQVPTIDEIEAAKKKFDEENILLDTIIVTSGRELATVFADCMADASNPAIELAPDAAEDFARLIDYLRDFRDIARDVGEVEKLAYFEEMHEMLKQLKAAGIDVCYAVRKTKLTFTHPEADKTPVPATLMYCSAFTRGKVPGKMAVPRQVRF
jgi:transcriptional regulator with XRE-family HTH domain